MGKMNISQEAIAATVREIEEPLITCYELADLVGLSRKRISEIAKKRKIPVYRVFEDGHYVNAYNRDGAKLIIESIKEHGGVVRKNKLTLEDL